MCKVKITIKGSNYGANNCVTEEYDIPTETYIRIKQIFEELNSKRTTATQPEINIENL